MMPRRPILPRRAIHPFFGSAKSSVLLRRRIPGHWNLCGHSCGRCGPGCTAKTREGEGEVGE